VNQTDRFFFRNYDRITSSFINFYYRKRKHRFKVIFRNVYVDKRWYHHAVELTSLHDKNLHHAQS
jgi:hypothetical protein